MIVKADYDYFTVGYGNTVKVYNAGKNTTVCTFTIPLNIYDLRISNGSIYVTTNTYLYHYNITLCALFDSINTLKPYKIAIQVQSTYNANERVFLWKNDAPS